MNQKREEFNKLLSVVTELELLANRCRVRPDLTEEEEACFRLLFIAGTQGKEKIEKFLEG